MRGRVRQGEFLEKKATKTSVISSENTWRNSLSMRIIYIKYQQTSIIDEQTTSARTWTRLAFEFGLNLKFVTPSDNNLFELTPRTIYESVAHEKENRFIEKYFQTLGFDKQCLCISFFWIRGPSPNPNSKSRAGVHRKK